MWGCIIPIAGTIYKPEKQGTIITVSATNTQANIKYVLRAIAHKRLGNCPFHRRNQFYVNWLTDSLTGSSVVLLTSSDKDQTFY
jgi:hypothetical protein